MSGVAIYMEGGGKGKESRSALRRGMDGFLRRIDAERVQKRCPHCLRLFDVVGRMMDAA